MDYPLTYVISLKEREDRREVFTLPWEFEFLLQDRIEDKGHNTKIKLCDLGAAAGHRQAVALAKEANAPYVLVLEDDAVYIPKTPLEPLGPVTLLGGYDTPQTESYRASDDSHLVFHINGIHAVLYRADIYDHILDNVLTASQAADLPKQSIGAYTYDSWLTQGGVMFHSQPSFEMNTDDSAAMSSISNISNNEQDLNGRQLALYKTLNSK